MVDDARGEWDLAGSAIQLPISLVNARNKRDDASMLRHLFRFLISRHFQAIILFVLVLSFISMRETAPVRTMACPFFVWTASAGGDLLVGLTFGEPQKIYETETLQQIATLDIPREANCLRRKFSPNGEHLMIPTEVSFSDGRHSCPIYLWNIKAPKKPIIIPGDGGYQPHAFSPDSTKLVAADYYRNKSSEKSRYTLSIWNVDTGERLLEMAAGHQGPISHVDWSPDGTTIATASNDGTVRLWNAISGAETKCLKTDSEQSGYIHTSFTSNGKTVIGLANNQKLISWDTETGLMKSRCDLPGNSMEFFRYSLEYDIVCSSYPVQWPRAILKDYDKWLPEWLKKWLQKQGYRAAIYRFDSETGSLNKIMTLRPYTKPLMALPGTQELLAYEATADPGDLEDGQLTWYSLDQSFHWLRSSFWAAGISLGYWLLLSLLAWRQRSKLKLQSTG